MIRSILAMAIACAGPATSTFGQDVDEILSSLQRRYESVGDVHASFVQIVRFGVTQSTQTFKGKIWIRKGNKYRVELEQQTIVTDGSTVWTYSHLNKQVFIETFRDDPKAIRPDRVLVDVPKNYTAAIIGEVTVEEKELTILKLVPKEKKSLVKSMKVWVDRSEWLMVQVEVLDVSDNQTTYVTKDLEINAGLQDDLFRFDAPPGVEVIDLRTTMVKPNTGLPPDRPE